jgi:NAD(P)-dependent dehydrogenase (short-subunit alcohol dehydrogenase family)
VGDFGAAVQDTLDINLTGLWNTIKAVVPPMIEAGNGGSIITISSAAGIKAVPGCGHHCASKFGVVGLTNSLAVELGEFGIRVNSVHPYGTDTPMGNDVSMYKVFQDDPNYIHSFSPGALPTDSLADPDLISDIVVWLASDASSLVTAAQIPADKGYLNISASRHRVLHFRGVSVHFASARESSRAATGA